MKEKPFSLYGTHYESRAAAIEALGLNGYYELDMQIKREALGLPFQRIKERPMCASSEAARRRYFERKLTAAGFWKKGQA